MKKACIALAALFLISALLTVSLGAAIGAREFRGILEGNGGLSNWINSVENWRGQLEDYREKTLLGETRTDLPFDSAESIFLSFDLAEVRVLPSQDGAASMHIQYYGKSDLGDLSSLPYTEQKGDGLHLGVRIPNSDGFHYVSVTANLYLPAEKVAALHAQISTGSLTVEAMRFGALEAKVNVGEIIVRDSSADTASLSSNTGELVWEGSSRAAQSLSMHTDVGDIRLAWPADAGFLLEYQTTTGDFQNQFAEAVAEQSKTLGAFASGTLRFGDGGCAVSLTAGVGDITLLSQAGQE